MYQRYLSMLKAYVRLALPIMLGTLSIPITSIANVSMIGSFEGPYSGETARAAAVLVQDIFWIIVVFVLGFSIVFPTLLAPAIASKDILKATNLLKHGLCFSLVLGTLLALLLIAGAPLLDRLGHEPEVLKLAKPYLRILALSVVPISVVHMLKKYADAWGRTHHHFYSGFGGCALNVGLNSVLIHGRWGWDAMGLEGAGWASLITRLVMLYGYVIYVFVVLRGQGLLASLSWHMWRPVYWSRIFWTGIQVSLQIMGELSYTTFLTVLTGWIGQEATTAHGIMKGLGAMPFSCALSVSSAATILVSRYWVQSSPTRWWDAGCTGYYLGLCLAMLQTGVFCLGYQALVNKLYAPEPAVNEIVYNTQYVFIALQFIRTLQLIGVGALRGIKDIFVPFLYSSFVYWCVGLPLCYVLAFKLQLGLPGIWFGNSLASVLNMLLLWGRFLIYTKRPAGVTFNVDVRPSG